MKNINKNIKLRFAPSPTGPFHIGGARSALFNWLLARKYNGKMILRIEDTDLERSTRESEENIKESLKWLGINWDEGIDIGGPNGPYRQSERLSIYREYTERLLAEGKAFKCYCTKEELDAESERQRAEGRTPIYNECCRNLTPEQIERFEAEGRKPAIRLKCPKDKTLVFQDLVRGHVSFDSNGVGDFIIVKSDGMPVYNYAVVIDDALMEVTHVIRAEEHLSNTPRQLVIYESLGLPVPTFGHVSLILGTDRKKMSKRHGATSVDQYRKMGYLPEAIINFLVLLGWAPEIEEEIFDAESLIKHFSMERVSSNPAVFDIDKLNWINFQYMKKLSIEELMEITLPHLQKEGFVSDSMMLEEKHKVVQILDVIRDHISYGQQVLEHARVFFEQPKELRADLEEWIGTDDSQKILLCFKEKLKSIIDVNKELIKNLIKEVQKETGVKGKDLYGPLRIAISGTEHGPDLAAIMEVLGKDEVIKRMENWM